ncbi:MAG TPA: M20/M25/M40 family metallo-hydrolase [Gemmatimonadaceae bacterium]|nr:M20/M25/M40 family metallo-hydrolase [Gemmatimonadaceae bacterium]
MIRLLALLVLAVALPAPLAAQNAAAVQRNPAMRAALERLRSDNEWTLQQQASICEIPAPPFKEQRRAEELRRRFTALGLRDVRLDSLGNVVARRPGTGRGPTVMISGHLDTVFPEGTDVRVTREGSVMRGPGIGDDCRGLAVVLAVARAMQLANVRTRGDVLFVGTLGEEGEGNLRGVRHIFRDGTARPDYFISVDGTGYGITNRAVGSRRFRVEFSGPGGHSHGDFGMPNPIHALGRSIAGIAELQVPATPKTTFSVGVVQGGTSVNSIAMRATMDLDLRSESSLQLDSLEARVRRIIDKAVADEKARWPDSDVALAAALTLLGERPAGALPDNDPIVLAAVDAARVLGISTKLGASSTDANVGIALGVQAITIDGGGAGAGAHSLGESYDDGGSGWRGPQWALLIVARLAALP